VALPLESNPSIPLQPPDLRISKNWTMLREQGITPTLMRTDVRKRLGGVIQASSSTSEVQVFIPGFEPSFVSLGVGRRIIKARQESLKPPAANSNH